MDAKERFNLITRNLQEIIGEDELKAKLESNEPVKIYWGTMTTGAPSIAYFFPMMKIADFLKAGCEVIILNADLHAALDLVPWEDLEKRSRYYEELIYQILRTLEVSIDSLKFVKGSSIQLDKNYFEDLLKLSTFVTVHDAKKASSEVVKSVENPRLSGLIYPLMQALDEEYLGVDAQLGGMDQRKILVFAREYLPKIGYRPRIELMNPMIRGLKGEKLSSSLESSPKFMDSPEVISKKINEADCVPGDLDNGLLPLARLVIFPIIKKLKIKRPEKYGGDIAFNSYEELESIFVKRKLHPKDLKEGISSALNEILEPFRKNKKLREAYVEAYGEKDP